MSLTTQLGPVACGRTPVVSQTRSTRLVPVRAQNNTQSPQPALCWQQRLAAATAAALLLAPAATAVTPKPPTLSEERAGYAGQLEKAVKDRGQQLKELSEYPLTPEQKSPTDQPLVNKLQAGNSSAGAGAFKLGEDQAAPSKQADPSAQLQDALPDFFEGKPEAAANAVKETAEKLPSPPANPGEAAKKAAAKVPSPAAIPNPASSAKTAAKKADAGSKSPDPKEAAATRSAQLLVGGVLVGGSALWYSIERKADPSLGTSPSSPPSPSASSSSSSSSPPKPANPGSGPKKDDDPFFQNVKERTK